MKLLMPLFLLFPLLSQAGTLQDFFKSNPELDGNLAIHAAISKASRFEAAGYARREGGDEDELMKEKGDQFGVLGFRRVKNSCQYPEAASVLGLTSDDCKIVLSTNL